MTQTQLDMTNISDSEWEVMRIIWTLGQAYSADIITQLQDKKAWSESTIKTLIRRLVQKGFLQTTQDGRRLIYSPTVNQTEMMYQETKKLLNRMCDMHKGEVLLKLLQDSPVSKGDLMKLESEIKTKEKTAPKMVPCNCLSKRQHSC